MSVDWNAVSSVATAIGSIATAMGVLFGAWQIRISKKQAQAEFEDSLDQQYRIIAMELPVDILIGEVPQEDQKTQVRELVFNYLDLSNEQVYLRAKGRVTEITWQSWCTGIQSHLARPAFLQVFEEVKDKSGFTYLEQLVQTEYQSDPLSWYR
ncbi:MAG: hypothetical protein COB04_18080 [Gammaproteobacteria bacterium]|nr:MAG: hypothetical protein COB04_18080 [Gammaproteobacteria bacterium]